MKTVTAKEMVEFIMGQPDDRQINYSEPDIRGECGCLMVHYGKHVGLDFNCVGIFGWVRDSNEPYEVAKQVARFEDSYAYDDFGGRLWENTTYRATKEYCRKAFPEFCGLDKSKS